VFGYQTPHSAFRADGRRVPVAAPGPSRTGAFCGRPTTPEQAREEGWEPYFYDPGRDAAGQPGGYQGELPTCPACCLEHLRPDGNGEYERLD
jgi:hypothetical protein